MFFMQWHKFARLFLFEPVSEVINYKAGVDSDAEFTITFFLNPEGSHSSSLR